MTITTDPVRTALALAKNFLGRCAQADADRWEASWGEGSARMYYEFPREVAAFFMTCKPSATRTEWSQRLASAVEIDESEAADLINTLAGEGMLVDPSDALSPGEEQWLDVEWGDALQLHWSERNCQWAHDYTSNPKVMTRYSGQNVQPETVPPGPFPCVPAEGRQAIVLPDAVALDQPFAAVQRSRRTAYQFEDTTITLADVRTILQWTLKAPVERWGFTAACLAELQPRRTIRGLRCLRGTPPHGAAAYTIYQYDPASNVLSPRPRDVPTQWSQCLCGQQFGDRAPMALILAANWDHFKWKYRFPREYRWVYTECGSFMQTALTVATGLGLRCWQTPALDDAVVSDLIGYDEAVLSPAYLAVFGRPGQ